MLYTLLLALAASAPDTAPATTPDTVVVCPLAFRAALQPWLEHRAGQGHVVTVLDNDGNPVQLRDQIRDMARDGRLRFVVLVGDAEPAMYVDPQVRARCVPTHIVRAQVNVRYGSEWHIATDNAYGDVVEEPGEAAVPELAVGRLPADTPEQLQTMVKKILDYERLQDFGPWRRRVNVVAGVGGFGALSDAVIESSATQLLTHAMAPDYALSMTYASWRSPYCPDPRRFHEATLARLDEGALFWVYLGHGSHLSLDRVRGPSAYHNILTVDDAEQLACRHGRPIALMLACHTGAYDATEDSLAEHLLVQPGGPVAVVAGSRVTLPYAMTVLAVGMIDECFARQRPTLGEILLQAKRRTIEEPGQDDHRRAMLDALATVFSPTSGQLAAERAEHLLLLNLLGDPLLRMRYPQPVELEVPDSAPAGGWLHVEGRCPIDGRATVELVVRRDRFTFDPPSRDELPRTDERLDAMQATYERANDRRLAAVEANVSGGRFEADLPIHPYARWTCYVRVFVEGADDFAMGSAPVRMERQLARKPQSKETR